MMNHRPIGLGQAKLSGFFDKWCSQSQSHYNITYAGQADYNIYS